MTSPVTVTYRGSFDLSWLRDGERVRSAGDDTGAAVIVSSDGAERRVEIGDELEVNAPSATDLRRLWEAWQAEIRLPGSAETAAYRALEEVIFEALPGLLDSLDRAERLNGILRASFRRRMREWREQAPDYSYGDEDVEEFLLTAEREADSPTVEDITGIAREVEANNPKLVLHINRARFAGHGVKPKMTAAELRYLPSPVIPDDHDLFRVVPGHEDARVEEDEVLDVASFNGGLRLFSTPRFINAG